MGGLAFAYGTVDERLVKDEWKMRPDLKPFKAMVPKENLDITERTLYESKYQSYRNKQYADSKK